MKLCNQFQSCKPSTWALSIGQAIDIIMMTELCWCSSISSCECRKRVSGLDAKRCEGFLREKSLLCLMKAFMKFRISAAIQFSASFGFHILDQKSFVDFHALFQFVGLQIVLLLLIFLNWRNMMLQVVFGDGSHFKCNEPVFAHVFKYIRIGLAATARITSYCVSRIYN